MKFGIKKRSLAMNTKHIFPPMANPYIALVIVFSCVTSFPFFYLSVVGFLYKFSEDAQCKIEISTV